MLAQTACSQADDGKAKGDGGVVSLNDATPKPSATGGSSRELAAAMVKCLGEADIPAEVSQAQGTSFVQITYTEGAYFECSLTGCGYQGGENERPSEREQRRLAKDYGVAQDVDEVTFGSDLTLAVGIGCAIRLADRGIWAICDAFSGSLFDATLASRASTVTTL